ncbi:MAG: hypothetical protein J6L93_01780, partial [Butyrivibrio sp.]|nr:hypothetical protein [Butyrivibrio sp.]
HKRMIIFILTDIEGLSSLDPGIVRSITDNNDLMIINIEDAFLTGDQVFDSDLKVYERFFLSHSKALHEEEVRQRQEIIDGASHTCKQLRAAMTTISKQEDIIESVIALLERYRNGYYG